jgi:putative FmdB family regulatory protein
MPIYEYRCAKGHTFEVLQSFADDSLDACEVCGAPAVRVLHAPAVHFKGKGFYNTDYGTKKRAREKGGEAGNGDGKGSDGKGSDGKATDAKPAADKPAKADTATS